MGKSNATPKMKTKPIWKPQKFFIRYHYQKEKWMITDQCGHYIGLNGEVTDRPKLHKTAQIAVKYLLMYEATPLGKTNHIQILKYAEYERTLVMINQRAKENARKDKRK